MLGPLHPLQLVLSWDSYFGWYLEQRETQQAPQIHLYSLS